MLLKILWKEKIKMKKVLFLLFTPTLLCCSSCGNNSSTFSTGTSNSTVHVHQIVSHEGKNATCTEEGWNPYDTCETCDYTTYESIPALNHDYKEKAVLENGVTRIQYQCLRCDSVYYKDCKIETIEGFTLNYENQGLNLTKTVENSVMSISLNNIITVSINCSWTLSKDAEGLEVIKTKNMSLKEGRNYAYIAVWTDDEKYSTIYNVDIYRLGMVTYTIENGDYIIESKKVEENTLIEEPAKPLKEGYTFVEWVDNNNQSIAFPYQVTKDVVIKPKFNINRYIVTFDTNGGSAILPQEYNYNEKVRANYPIKTNSQLYGWQDEDGVIYRLNEDIYVKKDMTLKAIWIDDFSFKENKDGTLTITKYNGEDEEVNIPENVSAIGPQAFYGNQNIKKVTIPNNVKNIGKAAFDGCDSLEDLTLPFVGGSVDKNQYLGYIFGASTYEDNRKNVPSSLKTITLLEGCENIVPGSFSGCSFLTGLFIPRSVSTITTSDLITSIGKNPFSNCSSLTIYCEVANQPSDWDDGWNSNCHIVWGCSENMKKYKGLNYVICSDGENRYVIITGYDQSNDKLEIPETIENIFVTTINQNTFKDCKSLISVHFPNSIINIEEGAFNDCTSLIEVNIPSCLTNIKEKTFTNCTSLTNIEIPNNITSIGQAAFSGCTSLESLNIPSSVTSIGVGAFMNCSSLTNINIPGSVEEIQGETFSNCNSLVNVSISNGVTRIGRASFSNCSSLVNLVIPNSIQTIGNEAFAKCSSLANINIPENVRNIGNTAFNGCKSLASISIPSSVINMGDDIFYGCSNLTIYCEMDEKSITGWNKNWNASKRPVVWNYTGENGKYNDLYFSICSNNENKYITITGYDQSSTIVEIPESIDGVPVTSISENAFINCTNLISITMPKSITSIGDNAFRNYWSLSNVKIPESVQNIGEYAFYDCTLLYEIFIPKNVLFIGACAFSNNHIYYIYCEIESRPMGWASNWDGNDEKFVIWGYTGVKGIYNGLYYATYSNGGNEYIIITGYDRSNTTLEIPETINNVPVISISSGAFANCNSLESIFIPKNITYIGWYAFFDCKSLIIYCEADSQPTDWDSNWNYSNIQVVWNYKK